MTDHTDLKYHDLPELDSSLPDNDLGATVSWILVTLLAVGAAVYWGMT
jgi:hypothetical protein